MAPTVPSVEPSVLRAGDTWEWTRGSGDFPNSEGWTLSYAIRGVDAPTWNAAWASVTAELWTIRIPATTTKPLTAGLYEWEAVMTGSGTYAGRRYVVAHGSFDVLPNLEITGAGERVSEAVTNLAAIRRIIKARLENGEPESYMIGGRQVQQLPMRELLALEVRFAQQVARERRPQGFGQKVQYRMTTPSA